MATWLDPSIMNAIGTLVVVVVVVAILIFVALLVLIAYNLRWIPMRGVKDEGFFTVLGEHKDGTYEPVTGEVYEATHLYLNRERELDIKKDELFSIRERIAALTKEDGSPVDDESAPQQLARLRPVWVGLRRNMNTFLGDCLIIHITRSVAGVVYFLVQYKNLKPLGDYATVSRRAGLEWVWPSLARRSRRLVKCWMDDVPEAQVRNLGRYSDLRTKGRWKWIRPYKGESPTPAEREPPPNMLIQVLAQESKVSRMRSELPTMQRQITDMEQQMKRQREQVTERSLEVHELRGGLADMGWDEPRRREALSSLFLGLASILVGSFTFAGFQLGQVSGGVLGALGGVILAFVLYTSGYVR